MSATDRRTRQRGNSFIEMAMTIVPLLAVLFGIIDIAMIIFIRGVFAHASREGVRWAITYSPNYGGQGCPTQAECIRKVVLDNSLGFIASGQAATYIKIRYYAPSDLSTPLTAGSLPSGILYLNQPGNVVEVSVENYPWNWLVPFQGFSPGNTSFNLGATTSDVMMGLPVGTFVPPPAGT